MLDETSYDLAQSLLSLSRNASYGWRDRRNATKGQGNEINDLWNFTQRYTQSNSSIYCSRYGFKCCFKLKTSCLEKGFK